MKIDLVEELADELGKIRDNLAAVLPDEKQLTTELGKLRADTLRGLLDAFSVLRDQDKLLFEAFSEWVDEDPGGPELMNVIPRRLWYREWLDRRTKETIGRMM